MIKLFLRGIKSLFPEGVGLEEYSVSLKNEVEENVERMIESRGRIMKLIYDSSNSEDCSEAFEKEDVDLILATTHQNHIELHSMTLSLSDSFLHVISH